MGKKPQRDKRRDSDLEKNGWARRFVADEPRLGEAVKLYKSLGYEVKLEPAVFNKANRECKRCFLHQVERCKTIYVRSRKKEPDRKEKANVP